MSKTEEMVKTSFRMPKSKLKAIQQYGLDNDRTDTDIFNEAIKEWLQKRKYSIEVTPREDLKR